MTASDIAPLTGREHEILVAKANGQNNYVIAQKYGIGKRTIDAALGAIYAKFGAKNLGQAIAIGFSIGELSPDDVIVPGPEERVA